MRGTSNRTACIWVAIAAITLAALSPAEARLLGAKARSNPVLEFLIKSHSRSGAANSAALLIFPRMANRSAVSTSSASAVSLASTMLPVFFVGLLAPLALLSVALARTSQNVPAAPLLAFSFQRPPPRLG
jgi:hypothetical protein